MPGPEHAFVMSGVGDWKIKTRFDLSPTGSPLEGEATERVEAFGPFFTKSHFQADFMGAPIEGSAIFGYEPHAQRYIGTWMDNLMPAFYHLTGQYDEATQTLTMTGEGPSPLTGAATQYRTVEKHIDDDHRELDMFFAGPDGSEMQLFHYEYERVK